MKSSLMAMLAASLMFAQAPAPRTPEELKTALSLTDSQITRLQQVQQERIAANRTTFEQIHTKQKALDTALAQVAPDATTLGGLLLDIKALRTQIQASDDRYQQQALDVLSTDQRTKLKALEDAAKLEPAIRQAISLNLLDPPARPEGGPGMPRLAPGPGLPGFGDPGMMMMRMRAPR